MLTMFLLPLLPIASFSLPTGLLTRQNGKFFQLPVPREVIGVRILNRNKKMGAKKRAEEQTQFRLRLPEPKDPSTEAGQFAISYASLWATPYPLPNPTPSPGSFIDNRRLIERDNFPKNPQGELPIWKFTDEDGGIHTVRAHHWDAQVKDEKH
ncbi:hypothetical protein BT69DRAFT_1322153 [Atractiella rhizophila]|nr:hypothetical protein BT69DRAFT_1322153 [Atractiella rhizophila]